MARAIRFAVAAMICSLAVTATMLADDVPKPPVAVRLWFGLGGTLGEAIEEQVNEFNAAQAEVRVELSLHNGYAGTLADFRKARADGNPPEIAVIENHAVPKLASEGIIAPFDDFVRGDEGFAFQDLFDATLHNLRWTEKLYALPINRSTPILYYNKQRFRAAGIDPDKPPRTWNELRETARKLTTDPVRSYGLALMSNAWVFEGVVFGAGGELLDQERKKALFVTKGAVPLQRWADMIHRDKTARLGDRGSDFVNGAAAMFVDSNALLAAFEASAQNFEVGTGRLPCEEGQKPAVTLGGGAAIMPIELSPEKRRAAWAFLKWIMKTEQTAKFSQQTGYLPVRKSAVERLKVSGFYKQHPNFLTAVEQLEFAREAPPIPAWSSAWGPIGNAMTRCLKNDEPAEASLAVAAQQIERILAGNMVAKKKKSP
jgi:sn-glycerol 3-phosphate transport system substrate-binding protein